MLLILDNFEQVVDAAVDVARFGARVLVTSQTPLRVRGERVIRLGPLELPDATVADPAKLAEVPSVALLVAHARASDSSFALTAANAADVARICTQLDGLPLALELAAARLALFGPAELSSRLDAGLGALGHGPRDLPPRQRGLRAALDWTCGLLSDGELALFLRLAVFAGGFTSALVEALASDDLSSQERGQLFARAHGERARAVRGAVRRRPRAPRARRPLRDLAARAPVRPRATRR